MAAEGAVTQEELESLLASLAAAARGERRRGARARGGARAVHEARVHDFARSERLSSATVQALEAIYASFAVGAAGALAAYLNHPFHIVLLSVDQMSYDQYVRSVPDPTLIAIFTMGAVPGRAALELNPVIAFWIVDRVLGGKGDIAANPRPLTDLEKALARNPLSAMLAELESAWQGVAPLRPELVDLTHSATLADVAKASDPVAVASFEVRIASVVGMASVCLPSLALKLAGGAALRAGTAGRSDGGRREGRVAAAALREVRLPCSVRLGAAAIRVAELADLRVGDVVRLDRGWRDSLEMRVGARPRFVCRPVAAGSRVGVEIVGLVTEE